MTTIEKITIQNYKCFKDKFTLELNEGINIIVGNNEAGKSTILEAINIVLSGLLNGRYIKNELSQYLFNIETETEYLQSLKTPNRLPPPYILIEVFIKDENLPLFNGNFNSDKDNKAKGLFVKIEFDDAYKMEYEALINSNDVTTIPIEYYKITWMSFAREAITIRSVPLRSILIDSSANKFQNGSDIYLSKIIKDDLEEKEAIQISQAFRKTKESFMADTSIDAINKKISTKADVSSKAVTISVDLSPRNSWENAVITYLDKIPFHQIGKGEQCMIKTNLALANKKAINSNVILIEEPENHLSYSKLNQFVNSINQKCTGKQIIISTHSSFIANKLNLKHLIILQNKKPVRLNMLSGDTSDFFQKLAGYETLRLILSKKAILVEGPSDELIVQRAYMDLNSGKLPIEDEIEIISVGLSFKRFLELAEITLTETAVVTDNDNNYIVNIVEKYKNYMGVNEKANILICADNRNNLNTLEPQLVDANSTNIKILYDILDIDQLTYKTNSDLIKYMEANKTKYALKIFSSPNSICYPNYILDAIK
jgi:putative ATP-dependent endonuclease of the OLD family